MQAFIHNNLFLALYLHYLFKLMAQYHFCSLQFTVLYLYYYHSQLFFQQVQFMKVYPVLLLIYLTLWVWHAKLRMRIIVQLKIGQREVAARVRCLMISPASSDDRY